MNILVTGPRGFVGAGIMKHYPDAIPAPSLQNVSEREIRTLLEQVQPDVIIHTAAISDIGTCAGNPEGSYQANVVLPEMLAKNAGGAKLVFFSSDQVYSGCKEEGPYDESITAPGNLYARHKLEMENRVLDIDPNAVLLRAEWMYDYIAPKGNYFLNILRAEGPVPVCATQYRGVTYLREVAEAMDAVMKLPGGAYNFGSETDKNMLEITREFMALLGKTNPLADSDDRHNLWMTTAKAQKYGVHFSTVSDGLKRCAEDYHLI